MKTSNLFVVAYSTTTVGRPFYVYLDNINAQPTFTPQIFKAEIMTLTPANESIRILKNTFNKILTILTLEQAIKADLEHFM